MKIEKRGDSVFISHDGLTVFVNKTREGYSVKATERLEDGGWRVSGFMRISQQDLQQFIYYLRELIRNE